MRRFLVGASVLSMAALTACSSSTQPEGDGTASIVLSQGASASASQVAASVAASAGEVALEDVASIDITITGVQAVRTGLDEEDEGSWVDLALSAAAMNPIDLLSLPGGGIEIASGELATGEYANVRIRLSDATISLINDVSVGMQTFAAVDSPHELFIPSGFETGIKVPTASFTVGDADGETVVIEFDPALSVGTVAATGTGLLMTPVLTEQNGDVEAEGEGEGS